MQTNLVLLNKKAIEAALKENWQEAVEFNKQILDKDPANLDAKVRLGRAFIYTNDFNKAKKVLKEVLEIDPINTIALRNYKMASEHRADKTYAGHADPKALIIEPGTTKEVDFVLVAKRITAENFAPGEILEVRIEKNGLNFFKKDNDSLLGVVDSDLHQKIAGAKRQGAEITANFVTGNNKNVKILVRSSIPVFKSEKQDVRPYMKKDSIEDEPELELPIESEEQQ